MRNLQIIFVASTLLIISLGSGVANAQTTDFDVGLAFPSNLFAERNQNEASAFCTFSVAHGVCTNNGVKRIYPDAQPSELILWLNFNDAQGVDNSGCMNNAEGGYGSGPSLGGFGYSGAFDGESILAVPDSHWFDSGVFSMTFWLFLAVETYDDPTQSSGLRYCPLMYKGFEDSATGTFERAPAIFLDRELRKLSIFVSTTDSANYPQGEFIISNAVIPYEKWTHIGLVRLDKRIRLYVNGILDSVNITVGSTVTNEQPLYIGNTPWTQSECSVPMFIDNLRFYTRELNVNEIQAEATPALGYVQPNFLQLGCINCPLSEAASTCIAGYHLCTTIEVHSAAYQVARSAGYVSWDTNIWTYNSLALAEEEEESGTLGTGLCCIDE